MKNVKLNCCKEELQELVIKMYWDFDLLSKDGKFALEKIAKAVDVQTEEELNAMSLGDLVESL